MGIKVQVCVMAYNLEKEIYANLTSIIRAFGHLEGQIYVMANGCQDATLAECQRFAAEDERVVPVSIKLGDKSNAWNEFVYNFYDQESIPVFLDGDLQFSEGAIENLVGYFLDHSDYSAISGFPWRGGRNSAVWQDSLLQGGDFTGNLYLLSPVFLKKIIKYNVKLPIGLIGDDSMLGFLCATDLCSGTDLPKVRIGACQDAVFYYHRLSWFSIKDIFLYLRRRVRYSIREIQQRVIVGKLKKEGLSAMPVKAVDSFCDNPEALKFKVKGPGSIFDWLAVKQISKEIKQPLTDKII